MSDKEMDDEVRRLLKRNFLDEDLELDVNLYNQENPNIFSKADEKVQVTIPGKFGDNEGDTALQKALAKLGKKYASYKVKDVRELNEDEIPSYLAKNVIFGKAVEDSVSFNDFQKRVYGILGPKYYKLTDQGALKDFYDSVRVTKPNLEEDDELNVNVDNANDNYAKAIDAESRSGAYESLQESLRKKLRERLK